MANGEQGKTIERFTAAFVLSLLAGLWMLSMGGMMGGFGWGMMGGVSGTAHFHNMMGGWMWGSGIHTFGMSWPWFGVLAGIVVLAGAVMLWVKPQQHRMWGLVVLVVSAIDFFLGMGGLLAGALGVIGGALAMGGKS